MGFITKIINKERTLDTYIHEYQELAISEAKGLIKIEITFQENTQHKNLHRYFFTKKIYIFLQ